jgi:hypothetical protein
MKFEVSEADLQNIMTFLDRVEMRGFKELQAMNKILNIFQSPLPSETKQIQDIKNNDLS